MVKIYVKNGIKKNEKDLKFKKGDHVRISKYKSFLQNALHQIVQKKFLLLNKVKILYRGLMPQKTL